MIELLFKKNPLRSVAKWTHYVLCAARSHADQLPLRWRDRATHRLRNGAVNSRRPRVLTGDPAGLERPVNRSHPLRVFMFHAVVKHPMKVPDYCFVESRLFKSQLDTIARHFEVLPLEDAMDKLHAGELVSPTAVITLDDGYRNNYTQVFPELQRRSLPATIFVSTCFVDSNRTNWFCRILKAVSETKLDHVHRNGKRLNLGYETGKSRTATLLMRELKKFPQEIVEGEVEKIERDLGVEVNGAVDENSPFRILGSSEIQEMFQSGLVTFGAHSESHAILARLSPEQQKREIGQSVAKLSQWLGSNCTLFAYPNGGPDDFNSTTLELLKTAGIRYALMGIAGRNQWYDSVMRIHREPIGPLDRDWVLENRLKCMVSSDRRAIRSRRPIYQSES